MTGEVDYPIEIEYDYEGICTICGQSRLTTEAGDFTIPASVKDKYGGPTDHDCQMEVSELDETIVREFDPGDTP